MSVMLLSRWTFHMVARWSCNVSALSSSSSSDSSPSLKVPLTMDSGLDTGEFSWVLPLSLRLPSKSSYTALLSPVLGGRSRYSILGFMAVGGFAAGTVYVEPFGKHPFVKGSSGVMHFWVHGVFSQALGSTEHSTLVSSSYSASIFHSSSVKVATSSWFYNFLLVSSSPLFLCSSASSAAVALTSLSFFLASSAAFSLSFWHEVEEALEDEELWMTSDWRQMHCHHPAEQSTCRSDTPVWYCWPP